MSTADAPDHDPPPVPEGKGVGIDVPSVLPQAALNSSNSFHDGMDESETPPHLNADSDEAQKKCSPYQRLLFLDQLQALCYKNWLLKTRDWVTLTSEILIPVIAMLSLLFVKVATKTETNEQLVPRPFTINNMPSYAPDSGFVAGQSQFVKNNLNLLGPSLNPNCSSPFTMVDSAYCNYHIALAPNTSWAVGRLVRILTEFDPIWKSSIEIYTDFDALYYYVAGKSYPDYSNGKAYLFFGVVFNSDGPDWDYTLMGNSTNSSDKSSQPNRDPPRIPKSPKKPDQFQKNDDEYLVYSRGFIQMQYLVDNFVVMNQNVPPYQVKEYWLQYVESSSYSDPPSYSATKAPDNIASGQSNHTTANCTNSSTTGCNSTAQGTAGVSGNNKGGEGMYGSSNADVVPPVPRLFLQSFPSPQYTFNPFLGQIGPWYGIIYVAALIWPVTRICKIVVEEKEERIVQGFLMMGTKYPAIWCSWLVAYSLIFTLVAAVITVIGGRFLFPKSNLSIFFLLLWLMGLATFAFSFSYCAFFDNSRLAQTVIGLLFFFTGLLNSVLQDPNIRALTGVRVLFSLMPTSALVQGMDMMANIESYGVGVDYSNWGYRYNNDWSVKLSAGMLFFDFIFYMLLGIYLNNVVPQQFGVALPWYYLCLPSYWKEMLGYSTPKQPPAALLEHKAYTPASHLSRVKEESKRKTNGYQPSNGEEGASSDQEEAVLNPKGYQFKSSVVEPMSIEQKDLTTVRMFNLGKTYKEGDVDEECHALRGLDLELVEGEILVLLGHNGAGKTTTLSVLSGLFPPSFGDAEIYGKSISRDMTQIRRFLGVCPQDNILYPILTVKEHLDMYAKLKGVAPGDVDRVTADMIGQIGLTEKVHSKAGTLSGGMKRKLSVGMAFIGNSKVVFLDEPTSGMDPYSRRATWDLLKRKRKGRVIVLTTHFMDEADYLGDRIAIMGRGRLICCGTALFLKKHYGVGYNMTVTRVGQGKENRQTRAASKKLAALVKKFVSGASVLADSAGEVSYRLPLKASDRFADMFDAIDADRKNLGVDHYGISVTTLEEVFLRVDQDEEAFHVKEYLKNKEASMAAVHQARHRANSVDHEWNLTAQDFQNKPQAKQQEQAATGIAAMVPFSSYQFGGSSQPSKQSSLSQQQSEEEAKSVAGSSIDGSVTEGDQDLQRTDSLVNATPERQLMNEWNVFKSQVRAMMIKRFQHGKRDRRTLVCEILIPTIIFFVGSMIGAFQTLKNPQPVVLTPSGVGYTVPSHVAYNTWYTDEDNAQAFLQYAPYLTDTNVYEVSQADTLSLSNYLLSGFNNGTTRYNAIGFNYNESLSNLPQDPYSIPLSFDYSADSAGAPLNVVLMFNSTIAHSLPMALNQLANLRYWNSKGGANKGSIKTVQQAFPLTVVQNQKKFAPTTSFYLSLAFTWVASAYGSIVVMERQVNAKHQQLISGVSPIAYWSSHLAFDMCHFLVPMLLAIIIAGIFTVWPLLRNLDVWILSMLMYNLAVCLWSYLLSFLFSQSNATEATLRIVFVVTGPILSMINILLQNVELTAKVAHRLVFFWRLFPTFCFSNSMANLYIYGNSRGRGWDMDVTGWNFVYMFFESCAFAGGVLLVERIKTNRQMSNIIRSDLAAIKSKPPSYEIDPDIAAEEKRVCEDPQALLDVIRLTHLRQVFPGRLGAGPKIAVHDLSFGIPPGECFGFLGINGAGKTTTMEMLTGKMAPTSGTAYLNGYNIETHQKEIRKSLGYCPQFDALIGNLTARETLFLYARLKGLPEKAIPEYVQKLITRLQIQEEADKPCKGYSLGDRRKLSVGVALIGNPRILFLDEPSTGMDPSSRRFMWELIASTMAGRSVILTTHSMEEAEALCARIGIMVGGRLRCIGTGSHLKHRYGEGYQIDINCKAADAPAIEEWIKSLAPTCMLLEKHGGSIKYRLPNELNLAVMFRLVEKEKERLGIVEYSLAETSLEQIFIYFAKQQEEEKGHIAGLGGVMPDAPGAPQEAPQADRESSEPPPPTPPSPLLDQPRSRPPEHDQNQLEVPFPVSAEKQQ